VACSKLRTRTYVCTTLESHTIPMWPDPPQVAPVARRRIAWAGWEQPRVNCATTQGAGGGQRDADDTGDVGAYDAAAHGRIAARTTA
jgi:hypothetical protein